MKTARHSARLLAVQSLYQWLLAKTPPKEAMDYALEQSSFAEPDKDYFKGLVEGVIEESNFLSQKLAETLNRTAEKLSPVEHAVLLVGTYELKNRKEIPFRVIINEAVRAAKTFGGADGYRFVNGVLDKIAEGFRREEILTTKNRDNESDLDKCV